MFDNLKWQWWAKKDLPTLHLTWLLMVGKKRLAHPTFNLVFFKLKGN